MAWVKLDDAFPEHEKAERVGDHAAWLFVCSLCYANRNRTDGLIPRARVSKLTGLARPMKLAETLVGAGLWERDGDDFRIHDYHDYQPTRAELETGDAELSATRAAAGKKGAEARWGSKRSGNPDGKPVANGKQTTRQTDAPVPEPVPKDTPPTPLTGGTEDLLSRVIKRLELPPHEAAAISVVACDDLALTLNAGEFAEWFRTRYDVGEAVRLEGGPPKVVIALSPAEKVELAKRERRERRASAAGGDV